MKIRFVFSMIAILIGAATFLHGLASAQDEAVAPHESNAEPAEISAPAPAAPAPAVEPTADPSPLQPSAPAPSTIPAVPAKKPRGKVFREKEAEGTQAIERIEADPVIKSNYKLNGQPLEVDPD